MNVWIPDSFHAQNRACCLEIPAALVSPEGREDDDSCPGSGAQADLCFR
jgi:hypothetical protein